MKFVPRPLKTNVNVSPGSPLAEFGTLLLGLLGIAVAVYLILGWAVDLVVPRIGPGIEQRLAAHFLGRIVPASPSDSASSLQELADALSVHCADLPYPPTVHIQKSPLINALALPGGHILVFTGLLDQAGSRKELAFVLAHEMGHFAHRDHLRALGRSMVLIAVSAALLGADSKAVRMISGGINLTELSFSRRQETRADEYALEVLHKTYGHVDGAYDFFEKLASEEIGPSLLKRYLSTHPQPEKRIRHMREYSREKGFLLQAPGSIPE